MSEHKELERAGDHDELRPMTAEELELREELLEISREEGQFGGHGIDLEAEVERMIAELDARPVESSGR